MSQNNPSPQPEQVKALIQDLEQKIARLPVEDQADLIADLHQLGVILQDKTQQSEKAGLVSNQQATEILESITAAFYAVDAGWRFTYVNQRAEALWKRSRKDLLGTLLWDLFPNPIETEGYRAHQQVMRERTPINLETHSPIREAWLEVHIYPAANGGLSVYFNDITERKRMEEELLTNTAALRESEQKFSSIFDHLAFAASLSQLPEGILVNVNEAWVKLFGYTREEVVGKTTLELDINPDVETRAKIVAQLQQGGSVHDQEAAFRIKAGDWRVFSMNIDLIDIQGEKFILSTAYDITDRKWIENALRNSEARERERANELEALMDAVPAMIWISRDPECRTMIGNRAGYTFLHMGAGANISKTAPEAAQANQHYENMKDGRPIPTEELPMQVAAATGKPAHNNTFDLVFDDGKVFNLIGNVNPLFAPDGKPSGAIGVFTDISELRRLTREQIELRAQMETHHRLLEQRERDRTAIARDLHDGPVQTLSSTLFNIQFTKEAFPDPFLITELEQIALNIKTATQELRQVIFELRPPSVIRFGLARAIQFHAEDLRDKYPELKLALNLDDGGHILSELTCLTLYRIYQEAILNVIHHANANKAWVHLSTKAGHFILQIRDNGIGLLLENNNIETLTEHGHYGLAGIQERVEALNGTLAISSRLGKGTLLQIQVPIPPDNS